MEVGGQIPSEKWIVIRTCQRHTHVLVVIALWPFQGDAGSREFHLGILHGHDARRVAKSEPSAAIRVVESTPVVSRQAEATEFHASPAVRRNQMPQLELRFCRQPRFSR